MFKKMLLTVGLVGVGAQGVQAESGDLKKISLAVGASAAVASTVTYWSLRESNDSVIVKVNGLWNFAEHHMKHKSASEADVKNFLAEFKHLDTFVFETTQAMIDRYGSWLTPWNWAPTYFNMLPTMRVAYLKSELLLILFTYKEFVSEWTVNVGDDLLERYARNVNHVSHQPVKPFVEQLVRDINTLKVVSALIPCCFAQTLIDKLEKVYAMVIASNVYRQV